MFWITNDVPQKLEMIDDIISTDQLADNIQITYCHVAKQSTIQSMYYKSIHFRIPPHMFLIL